MGKLYPLRPHFQPQSRERPRELDALICPHRSAGPFKCVREEGCNNRARLVRQRYGLFPPANKSSGITWSEETFPKYIRAPMQEMPGTRMAFVGTRTSQISGPISRSPGLMGPRT